MFLALTAEESVLKGSEYYAAHPIVAPAKTAIDLNFDALYPWGRAKDVVGVGFATNGLSQDHRDFLAAGGLGVLVGDGRLNYQRENILEAYYAFAVIDALTLTFDYQFVVNPAYNADRGPVSILGTRLHAQF